MSTIDLGIENGLTLLLDVDTKQISILTIWGGLTIIKPFGSPYSCLTNTANFLPYVQNLRNDMYVFNLGDGERCLEVFSDPNQTVVWHCNGMIHKNNGPAITTKQKDYYFTNGNCIQTILK